MSNILQRGTAAVTMPDDRQMFVIVRRIDLGLGRTAVQYRKNDIDQNDENWELMPSEARVVYDWEPTTSRAKPEEIRLADIEAYVHAGIEKLPEPPPRNGKRCLTCGVLRPSSHIYCRGCGAVEADELEKEELDMADNCCGRTITVEGAKFCPYCGKILNEYNDATTAVLDNESRLLASHREQALANLKEINQNYEAALGSQQTVLRDISEKQRKIAVVRQRRLKESLEDE